jgi:dTMP kinase
VLEGVEGAGKSTQARRLAAWCGAAGVNAVFTREPGGTALGEQIRRLLLDGGDVPPRSELLLMLAARAALVDEVIRPALGAGRVVIADRYELSTLAYQGYGRDLALREVRALNAFATGGLRADLTIVLDLPPVVGRERKESAAAGIDRIEREADTFHARVAEGYRALAQTEPAVVCLDASGPVDVVQHAILDVLRERFLETFPDREG